MALTLRSPNGRLALEVAFRAKAGREAPAVRVRFDGKTLLAWSFFPVCESGAWRLEETARARSLRARGGKSPVACEAELAFSGSRGARRACLLRVADDAVAILPDSATSPIATPVLRFPASLSHALALAEAPDAPGGSAPVFLAPVEVLREPNGATPLFLAYEHGKSALLVRHALTGTAFLVAADRPADAILPRTLRHVATKPPRRLLRALADACDGPGAAGVGLPDVADAARDVTSVWLETGYWRDDLVAAGFPPSAFSARAEAAAATPPAPVAAPPTPAHAAAFRLLADPGAADAATAFRGEVGEYLAGARRKGGVWHVAGMTAKLRVITLFFPFLDEGVAYDAEWLCDEGCAPTPAEPLASADVLRAGDAVSVRMSPSGGFVVKLVPRGGA